MLCMHEAQGSIPCSSISFGSSTWRIPKVYSRGGLNSRPSACKADVITTRLLEPVGVKMEYNQRQWCIGNIEASQALAPGSIPGWRNVLRSIFFFLLDRPMVLKSKKPTGGIEPPTFRLQSECSTTKLSRRACV
jgi:hypothetical protein